MTSVHKSILIEWVLDAIIAHNGSASIAEIAEHIWRNHEQQLRNSGDLFYTWQYDMRWAAFQLRRTGKMKAAALSPVGRWEARTLSVTSK